MKKILAAIDFSDATSKVLSTAAGLATALDADVLVLHVAPPDPDFIGFEVGPDVVREYRAHELREEHRELLKHVEELRGEGLRVHGLLIEGPTAKMILERAEKFDAAFLVLGSHGHGMLKAAIMGSAVEAVIHKSRRPVIVVPVRH